MFWAGFSIGIFLGATIGMVVAGLLAAGGRNDDDAAWAKPHVDHAVMDEVKGAAVGKPEASRPATYLDEYPYS
jgi:hypothetical protein